METDHESEKRLRVCNGVSVSVIKSPQLGVGSVFNTRNNDKTFGIMLRFSSMSEPLGEFMNRSLLCTRACYYCFCCDYESSSLEGYTAETRKEVGGD